MTTVTFLTEKLKHHIANLHIIFRYFTAIFSHLLDFSRVAHLCTHDSFFLLWFSIWFIYVLVIHYLLMIRFFTCDLTYDSLSTHDSFFHVWFSIWFIIYSWFIFFTCDFPYDSFICLRFIFSCMISFFTCDYFYLFPFLFNYFIFSWFSYSHEVFYMIHLFTHFPPHMIHLVTWDFSHDSVVDYFQ